MAYSPESRSGWQAQTCSEPDRALKNPPKQGKAEVLTPVSSSLLQCRDVYDSYSNPPSTPRPSTNLEKLVQEYKSIKNKLNIPPEPYKPRDAPGPRPYLFDALGKLVVGVAADTLDWDVLSNPNYKFSATSVTPGSILRGLDSDSEVYCFLWIAAKKLVSDNIVDGCLRRGSEFNSLGDLRDAVFEQFLAELGNGLMDVAQGVHITFIDPHKHMNTDSIRAQAQRLIARFESLGRDRSTVLVTISATLHGIAAAKILQDEDGINVNLAHVAGVTHAAACAEAGVAAVSLPIAPALEWHESRFGGSRRDREKNGVAAMQEIQAIAAFYEQHDIETTLIGTRLRHENDACALVALDMLSFDGAQAARAEWYNSYPRMTVGLPTPAISRAKEVSQKITSSLLTHKHGFYDALSGSEISMVDSVLYKAIGGMTTEVQAIQRCIRREVEWQIRLTQPASSFDDSLTFMSPQRPTAKEDLGAIKRKRESPENTPPKTKKIKQRQEHTSTQNERQRASNDLLTGWKTDDGVGCATGQKSSRHYSSWVKPGLSTSTYSPEPRAQRSSPSPSPTGSPQEEAADPFDEVF